MFEDARLLASFLSSNTLYMQSIFCGKLDLMIITVDKTGCILIKRSKSISADDFLFLVVPPPLVQQSEIVSVAGAGDWYVYFLLKIFKI